MCFGGEINQVLRLTPFMVIFLFLRISLIIAASGYCLEDHELRQLDTKFKNQGKWETGLVKSAYKKVEEWNVPIKVLLCGKLQSTDETSKRLIQHATFDSPRSSLVYGSGISKAKDDRTLEEDFVEGAYCLQLSMIQTCKITPQEDTVLPSSVMVAIQKRVSTDRKLWREKRLDEMTTRANIPKTRSTTLATIFIWDWKGITFKGLEIEQEDQGKPNKTKGMKGGIRGGTKNNNDGKGTVEGSHATGN